MQRQPGEDEHQRGGRQERVTTVSRAALEHEPGELRVDAFCEERLPLLLLLGASRRKRGFFAEATQQTLEVL